MATSPPNGTGAPSSAKDAVLVKSDDMPRDAQAVEELDFNRLTAATNGGDGIPADALLAGMRHMGFQASSVARAVDIIAHMRAWADPATGHKTTVFLGYTSNLVSSGLRGTLRYLVQHSHVSAVVTTAGGVEEDFIKCLAPTFMGSFDLAGPGLRTKGFNRIGNLVVPNDNYCKFEDWVVPILDRMLEEQEASKTAGKHLDVYGEEVEGELNWTPSKVIHRLGKEINHPESIYYWAYKNRIPVFCPALTDGSLGDMLYFHTFKASPLQLKIDIVEDIRRINQIAHRAKRAGMIILGGGIVKHHIANACLMRNGADYAVYINTAQEFDGSDAGARPDEAVSWGKIKADAESVKVWLSFLSPFPAFEWLTINHLTGLRRSNGMLSLDCCVHVCERSRLDSCQSRAANDLTS